MIDQGVFVVTSIPREARFKNTGFDKNLAYK